MPHFAAGGPRWKIPIHITPRFRIRLMTNKDGDSSLPVRTPSYMPGLTFYIPFIRRLDQDTRRFFFGSIAAFHHSNGQDEDEYYYDPVEQKMKINTYNGNFSTNYIEPALYYRIRNLIEVKNSRCPCTGTPYIDHLLRMGLEQHFAGGDALQNFYGNTRINFDYQYIRTTAYCDNSPANNHAPLDPGYIRERFRIIFSGTFIAGSRGRGLSAIERRVNAELSTHCRIKGSPNAFLFCSYWL
jgi:hypothetical protein